MLSPPPTSFSEYLHEKAEESRHNENVGYLIVIIGSVFFVGGLLLTVVTVENPEWLLIIPYRLTPNPYSLLSLCLNIVGVSLLGLGIAMGIVYASERSWYLKRLRRVYTWEEQRLKSEKQSEARMHAHKAPI